MFLGGKRHTVAVRTDITTGKRLEWQILEISDREQARIGQDVHDGLSQQLISAGFDINALHARLVDQSHREARTVGRVAALIDEAITQARQLARGLFPVKLEENGLVSALQELAASVTSRFKIACRTKCPEPVPIADNAVATHLYRIAQEAVNNAFKHSHARRIHIGLRATAAAIELTVTDDGTGISAERDLTHGLGLHIMDYRARTIGGTLTVRPGAAGGTKVSCCVPRKTV